MSRWNVPLRQIPFVSLVFGTLYLFQFLSRRVRTSLCRLWLKRVICPTFWDDNAFPIRTVCPGANLEKGRAESVKAKVQGYTVLSFSVASRVWHFEAIDMGTLCSCTCSVMGPHVLSYRSVHHNSLGMLGKVEHRLLKDGMLHYLGKGMQSGAFGCAPDKWNRDLTNHSCARLVRRLFSRLSWVTVPLLEMQLLSRSFIRNCFLKPLFPWNMRLEIINPGHNGKFLCEDTLEQYLYRLRTWYIPNFGTLPNNSTSFKWYKFHIFVICN